MHSSLDLDKDVFNISLVSIIQTGWWTGGTARWNGKVQLWPLERKSMLPFRICQKMRRSNSCSPAHVKLNNNNTITCLVCMTVICFYLFLDMSIPIYCFFCRYSLFPLLTNNWNIKRNRSVHQKYFWQIFITKDEGDDASLRCSVFF